jgi:hypothetical protein
VVSSVIVSIAAIATFIWALAKQKNIGPLWKNPEESYGVGRLEGSALSWTMMRMISSGIGGWAGGILYQSGRNLACFDVLGSHVLFALRLFQIRCSFWGSGLGPSIHHPSVPFRI